MLRRLAARPWRSNAAAAPFRLYNFASSSYLECFGDVPIADGAKLRADTIRYMEAFDPKSWHEDPVTSLIEGQALTGGEVEATVDAFQGENGAIRYATSGEVDAIIAHMQSFEPLHDYRDGVRAAEAELFEKHSAALIGNQALDFHKQDGVTEIEESVQANLVERRMNDRLLADEEAGAVAIHRAPAFVACVSNFTNFLDLSRKTLRNIELGVPVVVLSRSNTTQHMYRWTVLLLDLLAAHGVPRGLVTYAACEIPEQQRLFRASPSGAVYITSNRPVAATVRGLHGNVLASTGGPNTLVAPALTPEIQEATKLSAMIENSGQCTALRHVCVGSKDGDGDGVGGVGGVGVGGGPASIRADVEAMFEDAPTVSSPVDALRTGSFAAVFDGSSSSSSTPAIKAPFHLAPGYQTHAKHAHIAYRVTGEAGQMPPDDIDEHWRQTYVDVSWTERFGTPEHVAGLARWLVRNQPISTAMNVKGPWKSTAAADAADAADAAAAADDDDDDDDHHQLAYARALFEQTSQVVYTVGYEGSPALTCQARPQEGEIFGEFPVRREMGRYTKYPVVIPSSTPAYNSHYEAAHLEARGSPAGVESALAALKKGQAGGGQAAHGCAADLMARVDSQRVRGFCAVLVEYLADAAARGPQRGDSRDTGGPNRTILFGLQRPPLQGTTDTVLRCGPATTLDELAPTLLPFLVTNAADSARISVDPANAALRGQLVDDGGWLRGTPVAVETEQAFAAACADPTAPIYNVVPPEALADNNNTGGELEVFPLAQQFVSLYFPMGHIKSVRSDDDAFLQYFSASAKWLRLRDA